MNNSTTDELLMNNGATDESLVNNSTEDEPHVNNDTKDESLVNLQSETEEIAAYTFKAKVAESLPSFTFEIYETKTEYEFFIYKYSVVISNPELEDFSMQTLEILSADRWQEENREKFIDLVDIDFDGFSDIQAAISMGVANISYSYYRWNVFVEKGYGEFEETPFFGLLTGGYQLFPDTKQIISGTRDNAVSHTSELYQLGDTRNSGWLGKYLCLRHEKEEFIIEDDEEDIIIQQVFFSDEEIYFASVKISDDMDDILSQAENYLRFGVDNPIGIETALSILYDDFGTEDSSNGYKYSFTFEEMMLYNKLSCYKFRMKWLVEESYWSTIGYVGVTPNGQIINESEFEKRE